MDSGSHAVTGIGRITWKEGIEHARASSGTRPIRMPSVSAAMAASAKPP